MPILKEELNLETAVSRLNEAIENKDKEILALRQQLEALKSFYKNTKTPSEPAKKKEKTSSEKERSKQRIDKLMAALAETEKKMHAQKQEIKKYQSIDNERQKEREAKQIALEEVAALRKQLEVMKKKTASNQMTLKTIQHQLNILMEEKVKWLEAKEENFNAIPAIAEKTSGIIS